MVRFRLVRLAALVTIASSLGVGLTDHSADAKNACVLARALQEGLPAPTTRGPVVLPARYYVECGQPIPAFVLAADPTLAG